MQLFKQSLSVFILLSNYYLLIHARIRHTSTVSGVLSRVKGQSLMTAYIAVAGFSFLYEKSCDGSPDGIGWSITKYRSSVGSLTKVVIML